LKLLTRFGVAPPAYVHSPAPPGCCQNIADKFAVIMLFGRRCLAVFPLLIPIKYELFQYVERDSRKNGGRGTAANPQFCGSAEGLRCAYPP
jgi:hypothetical protein